MTVEFPHERKGTSPSGPDSSTQTSLKTSAQCLSHQKGTSLFLLQACTIIQAKVKVLLALQIDSVLPF